MPRSKATGEFIRIGDLTVHHVVRLPKVQVADRKPVVMLHGFAANAVSFFELQPVLGQYTSTYNIDLPGMGFTDRPHGEYSLRGYAEFLREYLDFHGFDAVDLVGHSLGGAIICQFALLYPERVGRMVLIAPLLNFRRLQSGYVGKALYAASRPYLGQALVAFHGRWFAKAFLNAVMAEKDLLDKHLVNAYYDPHRMEHTKRAFFELHKMLMRPENCDLLAQIKSIHQDVLLLWGEKDPLTPIDDAQVVARHLPRVQLQTFSEGGHMLMHECAENINRMVSAFLQRPTGEN